MAATAARTRMRCMSGDPSARSATVVVPGPTLPAVRDGDARGGRRVPGPLDVRVMFAPRGRRIRRLRTSPRSQTVGSRWEGGPVLEPRHLAGASARRLRRPTRTRHGAPRPRRPRAVPCRGVPAGGPCAAGADGGGRRYSVASFSSRGEMAQESHVGRRPTPRFPQTHRPADGSASAFQERPQCHRRWPANRATVSLSTSNSPAATAL